jgi:hypothetical protein
MGMERPPSPAAPATPLAVAVSAVEIEAIVTLAAQHVVGRTIEDDGQLSFWIEDGGGTAVDFGHEIGDPERAATQVLALAEELRRHALRIRRQARQAQGWT